MFGSLRLRFVLSGGTIKATGVALFVTVRNCRYVIGCCVFVVSYYVITVTQQ